MLRFSRLFKRGYSVALLVVVGVAFAWPSDSDARRKREKKRRTTEIEADSRFYGCSGTPFEPGEIMGNGLYQRNATNDNEWFSDTPLREGFATNTVNLYISLVGGGVFAFPLNRHFVDGFEDTTWEHLVILAIGSGVPNGSIGYGTGELEGWAELALPGLGPTSPNPDDDACSDNAVGFPETLTRNEDLADKFEDVFDKLVSAREKMFADEPDPQGTLGELEGAAADLASTVDDRLLDRDRAIRYLDLFARWARLLTTDAIAFAEACDPGNEDLEDAYESLEEGDEARAEGQEGDYEEYEDAIEEYKDALSEAEGISDDC